VECRFAAVRAHLLWRDKKKSHFFCSELLNKALQILSVRDRASLIDVLNENQRMQEIYVFTIVASVGFHLIHRRLFRFTIHFGARMLPEQLVLTSLRPEPSFALRRHSVNKILVALCTLVSFPAVSFSWV
jgi:hypothetical protein